MLVGKEFCIPLWLTLSTFTILSVSTLVTTNFENILAQEENPELEKLGIKVILFLIKASTKKPLPIMIMCWR
jgi:hypothetical protein